MDNTIPKTNIERFLSLVKFIKISHVTGNQGRSTSHLLKRCPITSQEVQQFVLELAAILVQCSTLPLQWVSAEELAAHFSECERRSSPQTPTTTTCICAHPSCFLFGHCELTVLPAKMNTSTWALDRISFCLFKDFGAVISPLFCDIDLFIKTAKR